MSPKQRESLIGSVTKGFGFIEREDAGHVFVRHLRHQHDRIQEPDEGDRVSFEVKQGSRGPAVESVTKL
jgi:CspA family cold shock protein